MSGPGERNSEPANEAVADKESSAPAPSPTKVRTSRSSWAQEVEARTLKLRDRLPQVSEGQRAQLVGLLDEATSLCTPETSLFSWGRFVDWWYGNRVERAWTLLHQAELIIIDNSNPELLPTLMEDAIEQAASLEQTDPARVRLSDYVQKQTEPIGSQK